MVTSSRHSAFSACPIGCGGLWLPALGVSHREVWDLLVSKILCKWWAHSGTVSMQRQADLDHAHFSPHSLTPLPAGPSTVDRVTQEGAGGP